MDVDGSAGNVALARLRDARVQLWVACRQVESLSSQDVQFHRLMVFIVPVTSCNLMLVKSCFLLAS
jgi:hypothetical protein